MKRPKHDVLFCIDCVKFAVTAQEKGQRFDSADFEMEKSHDESGPKMSLLQRTLAGGLSLMSDVPVVCMSH